MKNGWCEEYGHLIHFVNNKLHNEKSPAIIYDTGTKFWCQNNKNHRIDGSACEYYTGQKRWYYQGKAIECSNQEEFERYLKLKLLW